jgi:hypothetical protein
MNMIIQICIVAILNIAIRVDAFPSKVGCDLIGVDSTLSVMERNTIMGKSPITENNLIMMKSFDATSDPSNVVITLQLNGLNHGGVVIHTSFGELHTPDTLTVKDCSTFSSSLHYQQNNVPSNFEVTLSLPKIQNLPKAEVSVLTAEGYGEIRRQTFTAYDPQQSNNNNNNNGGGGYSTTTSPSPTGTIPTPPTNLETICDPLYFTNVGNSECMNVCQVAINAGCGHENQPMACDNWYPCGNLFNDHGATTTPGQYVTPPTHVHHDVTTKQPLYIPPHTHSTTTPPGYIPPPPQMYSTTTTSSTSIDDKDEGNNRSGSDFCGEGTKFVNGKGCIIEYTNLLEMCQDAEKNDWGWDCNHREECTA